jgi:hypothetical protein
VAEARKVFAPTRSIARFLAEKFAWPFTALIDLEPLKVPEPDARESVIVADASAPVVTIFPPRSQIEMIG